VLSLLKVGNADVAPVPFEVLRYEPAVAMVRLVLATQQATIRDHLA
jgi:hypothetical protein